ncbi:MAG: acetate--CoA ligase family protein, partial [Candidatus Moranbacteria bacterium]|nr:acetate--CoA ligase family protein [Candidatus Moranbacteria bacterium]
MNKNLEKLFNPASVAVVGATEKEGKVGNVIAKNLLELEYKGDVFLVNPKHNTLLGVDCFSSLENIEKEIDLAIVAIPAKFVNDTILKASEKVKNFIVISAGFSEIGEEGRAYEDELKKIAQEKDLNILGPNCLGFINPGASLNASFAGGMPESGNVALVSQSGALAVALMDVSKKERIKFSNVVSVGNKMQLNESDLIEYFSNDESTKVIALYLEGIEDGGKFIEVASKVSKKKPVVILKAGKSERAQQAISSHTGALAGSDEIMNAAFEKAGILRAADLKEFFSLIKLISNFDCANSQAAIVTNAGGPGVLATDGFGGKNVSLAQIDEELKKALKEFLPEESSVENPIDLLGDAGEERYQKALDVLESSDIENILCVMTAQDQTPVEKIAEVVADFNSKSSKNALPVFIGGEKMEKALEVLEKNDIPNFNFPGDAIDALSKYYDWNEKRKDILEVEEFESNSERADRLEKIISSAKEKGRKALLFGEAAEVMSAYDIKTVDFVALNPGEGLGEELSVKFPVALKVDSDTVLHKTDKQGLMLGIENMESLKNALEKMRQNFPDENLIIQPMIKIDQELILGLKRDSIFGPVVVFGLGGIYTEIFKMIDFLVLPASKDEIRKKVEKSKVGFLFEETRGKKVGDLEEMVTVL